jgi:putative addiction module killer protein
MRILREYQAENGSSPFRLWFDALNAVAAAKVTTALSRLAQSNLSNVEGVGRGVSELKIDFGPGYRVYFGQDGMTLVILLMGGTKKRQSNDIAAAQDMWKAYQKRKKRET